MGKGAELHSSMLWLAFNTDAKRLAKQALIIIGRPVTDADLRD